MYRNKTNPKAKNPKTTPKKVDASIEPAIFRKLLEFKTIDEKNIIKIITIFMFNIYFFNISSEVSERWNSTE